MILDKLMDASIGLGDKLMGTAGSRIQEEGPVLLSQLGEKGAQVATLLATEAGVLVKDQFTAEKLLPRVEAISDGVTKDGLVTVAPFAAGFVAAGGVGSAMAIPFRLAGVLLTPILGMRMEVPRVRISKNSRDLGRALAVLAAADKRMRRRRGLIGLLTPSFRKVIVLGGAGAAYLAVMNQNGESVDLMEAVTPALDKVRQTVESSDLYTIVQPDIERILAGIGDYVDAIR